MNTTKQIILKMSCMFFLILLSTGNSRAQSQKSTLQRLQNKVWVWQVPADKGYYVEMEFTDKEMTTTFTFTASGETVKQTLPYYLADRFERYYDSNQEGKVKNGEMILTLTGRHGLDALKESPTGVLSDLSCILITSLSIIELNDTVFNMRMPGGDIFEYRAKP